MNHISPGIKLLLIFTCTPLLLVMAIGLVAGISADNWLDVGFSESASFYLSKACVLVIGFIAGGVFLSWSKGMK